MLILNRVLSDVSHQLLQGRPTYPLLHTTIFFFFGPSQSSEMACRHVCIRIFLFLEFAFRIDGQASPKCQYQEYVCGHELVRRGIDTLSQSFLF